MDVSELKVLARRANGIVYGLPVFMLLYGFAFIYSVLVLAKIIVPDEKLFLIIYLFSFMSTKRRAIRRFYMYYPHNVEWLAFECALSHGFVFFVLFTFWIRRLTIPKVIIEYDDFGLYIYRKNMPVTLLRYESLWSSYVHEETFDTYEDVRGEVSVTSKVSLLSANQSGAIRFETPDGFITVSGIANVRTVESEIRRMVQKNRKEFIEEMERSLEEERRQKVINENKNT